jgi:hypothetical protein
MSVKEEIERTQYCLMVIKIIPQRPEHIASAIKRHPHMYPYRFVCIHKFEKIPDNFFEVYHVMLRKGKQIDGTPYGHYYLSLHGRGKRFGVYKPKEVKYRAGCHVRFDATGIKFEEVKCSHPAFIRLLKSALPFMKREVKK